MKNKKKPKGKMNLVFLIFFIVLFEGVESQKECSFEPAEIGKCVPSFKDCAAMVPLNPIGLNFFWNIEYHLLFDMFRNEAFDEMFKS